MPGWPGAHHSVDACGDLEEWSGGQDGLQQSDMEDEVLVQLVRQTSADINSEATITANGSNTNVTTGTNNLLYQYNII